MTKDYLNEILDYRASDGRLLWAFDKHHRARRGDYADNSRDQKGARRLSLPDGRIVQAHKVVWVMHYGGDPLYIYHKNGELGDNRIENLTDSREGLPPVKKPRRKKADLPKHIYKPSTFHDFEVRIGDRLIGTYESLDEALIVRDKALGLSGDVDPAIFDSYQHLQYYNGKWEVIVYHNGQYQFVGKAQDYDTAIRLRDTYLLKR